MQFITLEGADGTGKSTVQKGFLTSTERGQDLVPGVVDRLSEALDRPVIESREPGSYHRDGTPFQSWDPLSIERHFNKVMPMLGIAYMKTDNVFARRVLDAAAFVARYDRLPNSVYKSVLNGKAWPSAFTQEMGRIHAEWKELAETVEMNPVLMRNLSQKYNARDAIRHALIHATDSDELDGTAAGLMFFAGHTLHGEWLTTLPDDSLVISDRAAESNLAYGRARGDDKRIEELYMKRRAFTPDLVVLLTCEIEEIKERLGLRQKIENKSWSKIGTIQQAQEAYLDLRNETDYPWAVVDTTGNDANRAIDSVEQLITQFLQAEKQRHAVDLETVSLDTVEV